MIRALRQRHRRVVFAAAILLPVAFAAAVAARKPVPVNPSLPASLAGPARVFTAVEWRRADLFAQTPIQTTLLRAAGGEFAVAFQPPADFLKPDLLVYWARGLQAQKLHADARLLGAFVPASPLPLPSETLAERGVLILYSLAGPRIIDVSRPFAFRSP